MEKIMRKLGLSLILFILIVITSVNTIAYNNTNRNVIINAEGKAVTIYEGTTVTVVEGSDYPGRDIIEQPNVWCVQHGATLIWETYKAGAEKTVTDPILAYILNNGPEMGKMQSVAGDASQNALWKYLASSNYKSDDKTYILGGETCNTTSSSDGGILSRALLYKNELNSFSKPTISGVSVDGNSIKLTVSGNFQKFRVYYSTNNGSTYNFVKEDTKTQNSKEITINIGSTENDIKIKVESIMDKYVAKYRILLNALRQRLMISTYIGTEEITKEATTDVKLNPDVSMQKYITAVEGHNLTNSVTNITNRENRKTAVNESNNRVKNAIRTGVSASNTYKYNNPVKIEVGDTVTYRIYVYNNKNYAANNITVYERLPYYYTGEDKLFDSVGNKAVAVDTTNIIIKDKNGNEMPKWDTQHNSSNGCTELRYTISSLSANSSTYFDVTLKFNKYLDGKITNSAWIECDNNSKTYRTFDRDYVEMKDYSVSLEKYITKVEDKNISNRNSKRYNYNKLSDKNIVTSGNTDDITRSPYKPNHKVSLEVGDKVTYTIKLKNTGNVPVKITQIFDTFTSVANGIKLEYISDYGVQGNTNSDNSMNKRTENFNGKEDTYLIEFGDAKLIQPGKSEYVTIQFKVNVPQALTVERQELVNKAGIVQITNENGFVVSDSDGEKNNYDMDWVQTKTYAVSLEKFVFAVNGKGTSGREGKAEHKYDNDDEIAEDSTKYDRPETVREGDIVTYRIKVKNDGDTKVKITNIEDYFPNGVKYNGKDYTGKVYCTEFKDDEEEDLVKIRNNRVNFGKTIEIDGHSSKYFDVNIEVIENNLSNHILKNIAKITNMKNKNNCDIDDTTQNNNKDADYIQLDVITPTSFTVTKEWEDNGNPNRPTSVKVQLKQNGINHRTPVTLSSINGWTQTWTDLDSNCTYTVEEINVPDGYRDTYNNIQGNKVVITNILENQTKDITIKKVWNDNNNPNRPTSITVQLLRNLEKIEERTIGINDHDVEINGNEWTYTWENLDPNYTYTVVEIDVPNNYISIPETIGNVTTITNILDVVEYTKHSVVKKWNDNDNPNRPTSITVQLLRNLEKIEERTIGINDHDVEIDGNKWKYTWENLEKEDSNGNEYQYTVVEIDVPNNYKSIPVTNGNVTTITNTLNIEYIEHSVIKEWDDEDNRAGKRPDEIHVQLKQNGNDYGESVRLNNDNNWTHTWEELPKFNVNNNEEYEYTVQEINTTEYYTKNEETEDNNTTIINRLNYTELTVYKIWDDNDNYYGERPESIKVQLYQGNSSYGEPVTLSSAKNWEYTWELPEKDGSGNKYTYKVEELELPEEYIQTGYEEYSNYICIKNSSTRTKKTVNKIWNDNNDPNRPDEIQVQLYQNGNSYGEPVTIRKNEEWTYTWDRLPRFDSSNNEYKYTVKEVKILKDGVDVTSNYSVIIDDSGLDIAYITNTPGEPQYINKTVIKEWEDEDNRERKRPDEIYVQLQQNGNDYGESVKLNKDNHWSFTWENLPDGYTYTMEEILDDETKKYYSTSKSTSETNKTITTIKNSFNNTTEHIVNKIWEDDYNKYSKRPESIQVQLYQNGNIYGDPVTISENENGEWTYTWGNLPNFNTKNDEKYEYTVQEINTSEYYTKNEENISGSTIITNTLNYIEKTVNKVWNDNNENRPESVTVQLYQNGKVYGEPIILSNDNNWTYTWGLPEKDSSGKNYTYKIEELNVPNNYTSESVTNGNVTTITNTLEEPTTIDVIVNKEWQDENNIAGKRPESIQVQLYQGNSPYGDPITITENEAGEWTHTWSGLSEEYTYTVKEVEIPNGYNVSYRYNGYMATITNTLKEESYVTKTVKKLWEDSNDSNRPDSVKVQLYRYNNVTHKKETYRDSVILSEGNGWTYTWNDLLEKDDNNNIYIYEILELDVPNNYISKYEINGDVTTITNIKKTTERTVKKEWLDNKESHEPIQVQLYQNGKVCGDPITLSANNNWIYTWSTLDAGYQYTVKEINVPKGYDVTYGYSNNQMIIQNALEIPDVIIGGYVWNDKAFNKKQNIYNGIIDDEENMLAGIKVYLYREGVDEAISVKYTNNNGYYSFTNADIDKEVLTEAHEQYIKGPKEEGKNRWKLDKEGNPIYYSYYVVFEYDGVKYTSTPDGQSCKDIIDSSEDEYKKDSNAKEDNGKVSKTRSSFNNDFNTIKSDGAYDEKGTKKMTINYTTKNEKGYIPQSNHEYNSNMAMQSSTNLINFEGLLNGKDYSNQKDLEAIEDIEDKIKYIGLGLRGRDIFDLELTSDVDNIEVTVNNVPGVYKYSNKVTLRREDLTPNSSTDEDMANRVNESEHTYVDGVGREYEEGNGQEQKIRETDLDVTKTGTNKTAYGSGQGVQNIEVTYKITVQNTSRTAGTATKITNYYDDEYTFVKAYSGSSEMTEENGKANVNAGTKFGAVEITTPETMLNQSETMDIYVVYALNNPAETLKDLTMLPTYNMAEIIEYETACAEGQTEYTRGLIDKDSAPGSVKAEDVKLHPNKIGKISTVDYYFGGNDLSVLKYEDDTYATPTLYFVKDNSMRILEGTVFEDFTTVDQTTRIKTGNGIKNGDEPGVYGATVELVELVGTGETRYTTTTDKDGYFKFEGYLPGRYIVRYHYGDTSNTVLLHQSTEKEDTNKQSYNGEDYQATNNTGTHGANKLHESDDGKYNWYAYNEGQGVSTAKDNSTRRLEVSTNVTNFTDAQMTVLNNMRDLVGTYDSEADKLTANKKYNINKSELKELSEPQEVTGINDIKDKTKMDATTPPMLFTVEETKLNEDEDTASVKESFNSEYTISEMNFGIAEVPVTTIDLQKHIIEFNIMDSTGQNKIAGITRKTGEDGTMYWEPEGNVIAPEVASNIAGMESTIDVSIEDEKLQGSRLQVTYEITADMSTQVNFDGSTNVVPTITGLVDFIDNDLSYNQALGDNAKYWELTTTEELGNMLSLMKYKEDGTVPTGTIDSGKHTIMLKARQTVVDADGNYITGNPLLLTEVGKGTATITLEKVLSSTESTLEDIIGSMVDIYEYSNVVEIVGFDYTNNSKDLNGDGKIDIMRDRIRNKGRYIILPGVQYDNASAEKITIHPPTGTNMSITYYVMAVIGLAVLAVGVFGIKKYVIKK